MLLKLFGLMDLMAAFLFALLAFTNNQIIFFLSFVFVAFLVAKGIIYITFFPSLIDLVTAVFFVLAIYGAFTPLSWLFVLWLLQKGLFSLFSK